jgi:hypothetical protein
LDLKGDFAIQWTNFTQALKTAHIRIVDRDDELIWKHAPLGIYTPKLGYIQLNIVQHLRDPIWWWKGPWKVHCPLKSRIFMWCLIANKVPTWDKMKNR